MLEVQQIDVFHGSLRALWEVSFAIQAGEIVTLLGSNGAGKTTAVNVAQGLKRPASGRVSFLEHPVHRLTPHQIVGLGLCLVPEERHLFAHMNVLENLELGAFHRRARRRKEETLSWIYRLFPILEKRHQQAAQTLSGGEQQMVAIARGLMSRPKLLMMDEPSLGLAPMLVAELFRTVETINKEGVSILLVEQNARHALKLAQRAYVLETGRITAAGDARELLNDPNIRTAYLGM
jgi:branched-chain amino acid transport system ATP-binding protein